jgi:sialate O-acetylesterase
MKFSIYSRLLLTVPLTLLTIFASCPVKAQNPLPFVSPMFTDNMVLQRGIKDPIWGWTTPGAKVTVSLDGKDATATADSTGKWLVKIGPFRAGGPYSIIISGPETVTLTNVLVGDVWICAGQSNMEFGVGREPDAAAITAAANNPLIRIFTVNKATAATPQDVTVGHWDTLSPDTIMSQGTWNGFSAVGYFFGKDIQDNIHVPVGLIQTSWGGTPAEAWTSKEALEQSLPAYDDKLNALPTANATQLPTNYPSVLFNAMVNPFVQFGIKGVAWYQGESNENRGLEYRTLLPTMIGDWRSRWDEGTFPFLIVQLAGFDGPHGNWTDVRQAQWLTAQTVPNAGIATAVDIGEQLNPHPANKAEAGRRLALVAESIAYREKVVDSGPVYKSLKIEGSSVRITFTHTDGGLVSLNNGPLTAFQIAGADGNFVTADAKIEGDSVVVSSGAVPHPLAVQYGWSEYPSCSLYNGAGLPAFPFKTDEK